MNGVQKKALLSLARSAITVQLGLGERVELPPDPLFAEKRGVFVTLHLAARLRGCIGYIEALEPLGEAVRRMACQAAFHDPRFPALTAAELNIIDIEISVLSPLAPVLPEEIRLGQDGVVLESQGRRAVFLPQVASEQGWDRETLLDQLCLKAGLAPALWREKQTTLAAFTAEVFGERKDDLHSHT